MLNQIKDVKHSRLAEPALFTFIIMGCMFLASAYPLEWAPSKTVY
jgi:hypothetical protein